MKYDTGMPFGHTMLNSRLSEEFYQQSEWKFENQLRAELWRPLWEQFHHQLEKKIKGIA
jgi:hypothetical protein